MWPSRFPGYCQCLSPPFGLHSDGDDDLNFNYSVHHHRRRSKAGHCIGNAVCGVSVYQDNDRHAGASTSPISASVSACRFDRTRRPVVCLPRSSIAGIFGASILGFGHLRDCHDNGNRLHFFSDRHRHADRLGRPRVTFPWLCHSGNSTLGHRKSRDHHVHNRDHRNGHFRYLNSGDSND